MMVRLTVVAIGVVLVILNAVTVQSNERTVTPKIPFPFPYKGFDAFPASFFGANPDGLENSTELALIAKHQVSGWGWQQGCMDQCCPQDSDCNCGTSNPVGCPNVPPAGFTPSSGHENEEQAILSQAYAFRKYINANPSESKTQGVFGYRQLTNAAWWWRKNYDAYTNPNMRGFFLTSQRTGEYCWSSGPIWDFRNASAREYYVNGVIGEVTSNESDVLNMVFFDGGLGFLAADPHPSPSGLIGSSNCSIGIVHNSSSPGGRDINVTDSDRLDSVFASLSVLKAVGIALNAKNIIPIFSLTVPFDPVVATRRGFPGQLSRGQVFTESEVVAALENIQWIRYYEWFQSSGWSASIGMSIENMINETSRGIGVITHSYPSGPETACKNATDPSIGSAVAAFLIAMGPYCYFETSSSIKGGDPWTDTGWCWHPLYDIKCGEPTGLAIKTDTGEWQRKFEFCNVTLDQKSNKYSIKSQTSAFSNF